jgi:hypothetical protein
MKKVVLCFILILGFSSFAFSSDVTWRKDVEPILKAQCYPCHSGGAPELEEWELNKDANLENMQGMKMDTFRSVIAYVVWPNTGALMRRLDNGENKKDGKPGNMYEHLGSTDDERAKNLETIKSWVGYWTTKRIKDLTYEEILKLDSIKKRY